MDEAKILRRVIESQLSALDLINRNFPQTDFAKGQISALKMVIRMIDAIEEGKGRDDGTAK